MMTAALNATPTSSASGDPKSIHGISSPEHREIHALITYKGGFVWYLSHKIYTLNKSSEILTI